MLSGIFTPGNTSLFSLSCSILSFSSSNLIHITILLVFLLNINASAIPYAPVPIIAIFIATPLNIIIHYK